MLAEIHRACRPATLTFTCIKGKAFLGTSGHDEAAGIGLVSLSKCVRGCRAEEVRLLAEDKEMLGIFGLEEAIEQAEEVGLDVVLISADASPPVCRMMDASKYKYELDKRDKEAKKKQREAR